MQTSHLKNYAPKARRDFIAAVTRRAAKFGITAKGISPNREEGELVFIDGQPYPKAVGVQRRKLAARIEQQGFQQVMEAAAYTWFNRFAAIRFMELHGYLEHPFRVLSPAPSSPSPHGGGGRADGGLPEILDQAQHVDLPGLDRERVIALKMDGTRDEELYRDLLLAQCRALHQAMPFLFEPVDDETELLLPDNLLQTDSLIRELVTAIPEADWQEIEIIGWLYQFYISEKKDQVIGKVVKPEDIPAATQLFTPNWIVKYMVQNSLGAQWLATYPDSPLKAQMEYYIEPAEQTEEVKARLKAITPASLNPEELTLMDPACGSGHILVEAYDLFKAMYLERGYRQRDVARLIVEKNLFGLDIDARAAQLAGFALMMKARADDRRLFERGVQLNVMALVNSTGFDVERLAQGTNLPDYGLKSGDLTALERLFEHATTFGSLIQVPEGLTAKLPALKRLSEATGLDLFVSEALECLGPLVRQAALLAARYDAVVTNPPYMGTKFYPVGLKRFVNGFYSAGKADLYGAFSLRNIELAKDNGHIGMITIPNWMFLSSFEQLRDVVFARAPMISLVHNGRGVWGPDFGSCSYVLRRSDLHELCGQFLRLFDKQGSVSSNAELKRRFHTYPRFKLSNVEFKKIPGHPVAYWLSRGERELYVGGQTIASVASPRKGIDTGENARFLRMWWEVETSRCSFIASPMVRKWFPYNKGGDFRRWYGNRDHVVNWQSEGAEIRSRLRWVKKKPTIRNAQHFLGEGFTWTTVSIGGFSIRYSPPGAMFDNGGSTLFCKEQSRLYELGALLNSTVSSRYFEFLSPTLNFQPGDVGRVLYQRPSEGAAIKGASEKLVRISRGDWNAYERSWDFQSLPLLTASSDSTPNLESSYTAWITQNRDTIAEMRCLEEENNRLFIGAYGLQDELTPEVPIEQITLTVNPAYRYGKKVASGEWSVESGFGEELEARFRQDTMRELVSYAIGCAMGRYRLDRPGLIYAHSGNERFWEIYEGGDRGEGRGASKELPGSDCVAEVDGGGGTGIPDDQSLSSGGAIRPQQSDSAGGGLDSIEHRGGPLAAEQRGVSELYLDRSGLQGRSRDTDLDRRTAGVCDGAAGRNDPLSADRVIKDAQHPATQTRPSPLIPNPFPPDADGIIPITDNDWFDDDATHRVVEFISVAWGGKKGESEEWRVKSEDGTSARESGAASQANPLTTHHSPLSTLLEENLKFLADSLAPKKGESSREAIRRYLCDSFFKDHLQTCKNRPIYWCFTSGKQKAFQCLVYLHRYNEGTLARMRMEYVVPLQSKMAARIDRLADDVQSASTSAQAKRLQKERDKLTKQLDELRRFDEQLRHYADQRIQLDLDDGVKVNYGKFGALLAETKVVIGRTSE